MKVHTYTTDGGKDLIREYLDALSKTEKADGYNIMKQLEKDGVVALQILNTRQLKKKLWEIKFYRHNRIMYILADEENIFLLHACQKQKGKAEKFELSKATSRVKELEQILNKKLI
jgi:phage-related protein